MRLSRIVPATGLFLSLLLPLAARADVTVFAAASTTDVLNEIGKVFVEKGGAPIVPSYASSSTLAKQIEAGAPANLFLSADERWMDYLDQKKLLAAGSRSNLLGNEVVLIAPKNVAQKVDIKPGFPLATLLGEGRLAVGDPAHVPVGAYTEASLKSLGVWDSVKDKLAPGDSVRAALAYVERGETPYGVVYATDAAISGKVSVAGVFPEDSHPPVVYPVALVDGKDTPEAKAFLAFLRGPEAKALFEKYGFTVK